MLCGLEAESIFESSEEGDTEGDLIETYEILARCYEIMKKGKEIEAIREVVCEKFNVTEQMKVFERMAKIVVFSRLKELSTAETKAFLKTVTLLAEETSEDKEQSFSFLQQKAEQCNIMKKFMSFTDNIVVLYD